MKEKRISKITVVLLIIVALIMGEFIFVGYNFVQALYEELEQQNTLIANSNVSFDAYFKNQEEKIHSKQIKISDGDRLYINLYINNTGVLNDSKIKIENSNFKIKKDAIKNQYVKWVDEETNEIGFNQITYGNEIEIEIPIEFNKKGEIPTSYFEMENSIVFSGKYKESDEKDKEIKSTIKTRVNWTDETDVELNTEIDKYFSIGEEGTLIQQLIHTKVIDNKLPKQSEKITTSVPVIENEKPKEIAIIQNGKKMDDSEYSYNQEGNTLEFNKANTINGEKISWIEGTDTYKIVYLYDSKIGENARDIEFNVKAETKLYTIEDAYTKQEEFQNEVTKKGNSASISGKISSSIYKGYLYANAENETTYLENYDVEISQTKTIEETNTKLTNNVFSYETNNDREQLINTNGATYYKSTKIDKENMIDILGNDGTIQYIDNSGNVIGEINQNSEAEDGYIVFNYGESKPENVTIKTTKPQKIGNLRIINEKAIKGKTGYTKEQLRNIKALKSQVSVITNLETAVSNEMKMDMLETKTEAELKINNSNLTTLETNKNVEIIATFKTLDNRYDLYKNAVVQIQLPEGIEDIQVNSINKKYDEELEIREPSLVTLENGRKAINLVLAGEQTNFNNTNIVEGMQIIINADITFAKKTPTKIADVVMLYSNQNGLEQNYQTAISLNINSKYGMMVYSKVSGYNDENETMESFENKNLTGEVDIQKEKKVANIERTIINNYDQDISNISIVGKIPEIGEESINDQTLKSTFISSLEESVKTNNPESKIYYSQDTNIVSNSDQWQEQVADMKTVRTYKVVLPNDTLKPGQMLDITSNLEIPENLSYNQSSYETMNITYSYDGQEKTETYASMLSTESATKDGNVSGSKDVENSNTQINKNETTTNPTKTEQVENIGKVEVYTTTGGKHLKDGDNVYEGQAIQYKVIITNTTEADLEDVKVKIDYPNANLYDEEVEQDQSSLTGEMENYTYIREIKGLTSKTFEIGKITKGESKTINYQLAVKENVNKIEGNIKISTKTETEKVAVTTTNNVIESKIKASLPSNTSKENPPSEGRTLLAKVKVDNISNEIQKDIIVKMDIPKSLKLVDIDPYDDNAQITIIKQTDAQIEFKINSIPKAENAIVNVRFTVNTKESEEINLMYFASIGSNVYPSNLMTIQTKATSDNINGEQTSNINSKYVKTGDKLNYIVTLNNNTENDHTISFTDDVPTVANIDKAYYEIDGKTTMINNIEKNYIELEELQIKSEKTMKITIETTINEELSSDDEIENEPSIFTLGKGKVNVNTIKHTLIRKEDPEEDDNGDVENSKNAISGYVWLDKNRDGAKDEKESKIEQITVKLIGADTKEKATTKTDSSGKYEFKNIENGQYIVVFEYDTIKYAPTVYKATGIDESVNSDITAQSLNGKNVGLTDVITLNNKSVTGINAGLVENKIFDLKLDKYVNKVLIQNNKGTTVKEYQDSKLAKLELDAKNLNGTTLLVEYKIAVTNEGEVAGYANEIVDYMPNDMKFNSEINKNWYLANGSNLRNTELSKEIIKPGETKFVTLTLIKTMTENSTGITVNTAEISKSSNDLNIKDRDSTEANKVQGEDDISTAEVIISIRTGAIKAIGITTIIIILVGVAIGVYIVKRKED